jgi:thioredoxin 1
LTLPRPIPNFPLEAMRAEPRRPGIHKETNSMANAVSDSTFDQEVLKSTEPVLVDFFAEWCGPCKAMAPALEQVAKEMEGKVKIVKPDVDQNPNITGKYGIRAMPTLILFKNGQPAAQHTGALVQKKKLEDWINSSVTA